MKSLNDISEAQNAYKKFVKSFKGVLGFNFRKRENLKSFSVIQKEENAYNSVELGVIEVPTEKIIGSVEKYEDFDKNFIPRNKIIKTRWENIYLAYIRDEMLPPVTLYKIKDLYYVYDGNHRVSVAKYLNFASVEAEVREFIPGVNKKEEIIYRENIIFEKKTGIINVLFSDPVRYKYLKNEIENYLEIFFGNSIKEGISEKEYKLKVKKWESNVFEPVKKIILANNLSVNFDTNNINDIFSFFLEHKYYLSKNFDKDTGYVYSLINFINFIKTGKDRNLDSECSMEGNRENWEKLLKTDFFFQTSEKKKLENEKREKIIQNYFAKKIKRLPNKYEKYFNTDEGGKKIFSYISEYTNIKMKKNIYELKKIEETVLNYIIEIFIPVAEFLNKNDSYSDENNIDSYEKIQKDYFFLLENEKDLISEGKIVKYEDLAEKGIKFGIDSRTSLKQRFLMEKTEELLKNLKDRKKILKIFEKYGKPKQYKTLKIFFEWLDTIGEKEFLKKIEKELSQLWKSEKLVLYKTEKNLAELKNENILSFVDYYVNDIQKEEKRNKVR